MKWSDFIAKENLEKMQKYHDQRSKGTGSPPSQYESRIVNKAGEVKTVIANVSLIGKQRIVSLTDITEQKLAAIENEQLHKKLAQAQKMEAIGSLAGGIAHDFNNILGAIIGYTELAKMDKIDSKEIGKHLNKVLIAADRAKNLVHQILTFSRQTEQKIRPLKVEPIIKEVLQLLRASLPSTIEIQSDINNKSLIMGDPTQIHQVILNLCTNAGHAMQENGGTLYVGLTNEKLGPNFTSNIPDASTDDYVKIEVKDTGHGIPPELIERLFEPFFTTKGPGEGTGMGLAVVHGIVKSMKGEIIVESVLGKGSAFSVYLPVVQDMAKTDEPKENALAKGRGHILFVDDEPSMVDIGELILTQLGYHVTIRTSGIEALEAFKSNPDKFDLVLTDMTMPRMTGEKLAKEILSIRKEIPIIICTGFSSAMTEEKALEIGVKGLLMKPFIFSELAGVIHNVLKKELSNVHCCQCKSEGSICTRT
ncbi:MAG: Histidine kinase [Thermodesulfobacteriota bacterium]|nr:Histidine kinase [Thermodesulfobacteriota bacterium]